jgi:glycosyltransferase involved in cell wall biosynthesis
MKILWFTATPVKAYSDTVSGSWSFSMYDALSIIGEIEIYNIVISRDLTRGEVTNNTIIIKSTTRNRQKPGKRLIEQFNQSIVEINPDLVHIWGTEWNGAYLASKAQLRIPVLVSIQGIADTVKRQIKGTRNTIEILRWLTIHDLFASSGLISLYRDMTRTTKMEIEAIERLHYFECATPFMEAWVRSINNQAEVFCCNSILRSIFYRFKWSDISIKRYSLFLPDAFTSYKGFDVMLRATKILIKEFPSLQIRVAGTIPRKGFFWTSGYERYLNGIIENNDLKARVIFLGPLTSGQLSREMLLSNCVVISSLIESQSLILLESMMLGVPTVASYAGGMPELFTNMQSALGYPVGDHIALAHSIRRLFNDPKLAIEISENAYNLAHRRNEELGCTNVMVNIYKTILAKSKG